MSDSLYDAVCTELDQRVASMRCADLKKLLESLGFNVRDGRRGGHKICTHPALSSVSPFTTFSFDGGRNPILSSYVREVLKTLRIYESEIRQILGE